MTQVLIIDESPAGGCLLKQELASGSYQVSVVPPTDIATLGSQLSAADIVLVNHACRGGHGWDIFRQIKMHYQKITVMLYVLESWSQNSVKWIMQAVHEALSDAETG